ncbi:MAG: hypothetical protein K1X89_14880 [Myxococcaceae bacterium]|nr:hypothetical protein [Myxococcaceae bacterium]
MVRRLPLACVFALTACGGGATSSLPAVKVSSKVAGLEYLSAAAFDVHGVLGRADRVPQSGAPTLPGTLRIDAPGRDQSALTIDVWGWAKGQRTAFGTVTFTLGATPPELVLDAMPPDTDGDGLPDVADRCVFTVDPDQRDADGDGSGDLCGCRENRLDFGTFDAALDRARWSLENASLEAITPGAAGSTGALRICRTASGMQFGATASVSPLAGVTQVRLEALLRTTTGSQGGTLLRQAGGCDSWTGSCNTGGIQDVTTLGSDFARVFTSSKVSSSGNYELEVTSYDAPLGRCIDVDRLCLVQEKP